MRLTVVAAFAAISVAAWGALIASARADPPSLRVDDFEDLDLEAATGLSWTALGDWLMGGESSGAVAVARPSAGNASRGALRIDGHLRGEHAFAGAWVALRADGTPADLTGYGALRFRVRGTPGRYEAGVRRTEGKASTSFMAPFTVGAAWAAVELPFGDLKPTMGSSMAFATTGIGWLGVTSSSAAPRDFAIEIDDVELVPAGAARAGAVHKLKLTEPRSLDRLAFAAIGRDDRGDGTSPRLPDARELQLAIDPADDRVWFRFVLQSAPPADAFGLNIALDVDGNPGNGGAWWGQNKAFHYDVLVTAYLSRGAGYWQGFVGVADPAQVATFAMDGRSSDVRVVVDPARRTLAAGVPRAALGLPAGGHVRLIGTVGSSFTFSDDVPAEGALEVDVPDPAGGHSVSH